MVAQMGVVRGVRLPLPGERQASGTRAFQCHSNARRFSTFFRFSRFSKGLTKRTGFANIFTAFWRTDMTLENPEKANFVIIHDYQEVPGACMPGEEVVAIVLIYRGKAISGSSVTDALDPDGFLGALSLSGGCLAHLSANAARSLYDRSRIECARSSSAPCSLQPGCGAAASETNPRRARRAHRRRGNETER
jgi:hypothetical protein